MGQFTTGQLTTLKNGYTNDPELLGFAAYLSPNPVNVNAIADLFNWIRDGQTPCPDNGIIGPTGAITGATNATPIVIASTAHGRTTGDTVVITGVLGNTAANNVQVNPIGDVYPSAPVPSWVITVIDANHFSLNSSVGNGAYTSGGTWTWCVAALANTNKIFNQTVPVQSILNNIAPGDANTVSLNSTQQVIIAGLLNPLGSIQIVDASGNETNGATWLQQLTTAGSISRKAVKALETRFGTWAEQLISLPGVVIGGVDVEAMEIGHY